MKKYEHLQKPRHMKNGTWVAENPWRIAQVQALLGMQDCRPAPTPGVKGKKDSSEDLKALDEEEASTYRSVVGILLYISHGRYRMRSGQLATWRRTSRTPRKGR